MLPRSAMVLLQDGGRVLFMISKEQADQLIHKATQVTMTRRQHYAAEQAISNLRSAVPLGITLNHDLDMLLISLKQAHNDAITEFRACIDGMTE